MNGGPEGGPPLGCICGGIPDCIKDGIGGPGVVCIKDGIDVGSGPDCINSGGPPPDCIKGGGPPTDCINGCGPVLDTGGLIDCAIKLGGGCCGGPEAGGPTGGGLGTENTINIIIV